MLKKKKVTKNITNKTKKTVATNADSRLKSLERKTLICKECNIVTVVVSHDIGAVVCAYCVQQQVGPPENSKPKNPGEKFPRGWHFKQRYVHTDGRVFCKGVETSETDTPPSTKKKIVEKKTIKKKRK